MKQRSKEWFEVKRGNVSASNFYKIAGARGLGKTGESYILELVCQKMGVDLPEISSAAINWGVDLEDDAREYYSLAAKAEVEQVGFIAHNKLDAGCSPDGKAIDSDLNEYGLELKCPFNPGNHVNQMRISDAQSLLDIEPKYYWQVMFSLWVTGWKYWHFASYDPRYTGKFRMHIAEIHMASGVEDFIEERVREALKLRDAILKDIGYES